MAFWSRKEAGEISEEQYRALASAIKEVQQVNHPPRAHFLWVADWTVYLNDSSPIEVLAAYLRDPISWEAAEPAGTIKPSDLYVFKTQRAPHKESFAPRFPVEHIVAQFDRFAVKGVVSQHWRWINLGVW